MIVDEESREDPQPKDHEISDTTSIPEFKDMAKSSETSVDVSEMMSANASWIKHRLDDIKVSVEEVKKLLAEFLNEKIKK